MWRWIKISAMSALLLCAFGAIKWELFGGLLLNGFLFKVVIALVDTPLFYFFAWLLKRRFQLGVDQNLAF